MTVAYVDGADHSVGTLVKQGTEQLSQLVRQELKLAQAELTRKGKRAGIGGGLFGALAGERTGKHVSRRVAASNFSHPWRVDSWHWGYAGQLGRLAHAERGEQQRC